MLPLGSSAFTVTAIVAGVPDTMALGVSERASDATTPLSVKGTTFAPLAIFTETVPVERSEPAGVVGAALLC